MATDDNALVLEHYKSVFGLTDEDLIDEGAASERKAVLAAWADYALKRDHAFTIDPDHTAIIVVDMQQGFLRRDSPQWIPHAERIVPKMAGFADKARAIRVPVIFTSAQFLDPSPTDVLKMSIAIADGNLASNTSALEIAPALWQNGDILIGGKHTYDAFFETDLDYRLKSLRCDTLVIAGTLTNVCCEATARAGFDRGYHVALVSDLCATDNPFAQSATLQNIRRSYGRVLTSEQVVSELQQLS